MIDYEAIIKALDERYLAGFKSVSEVFAKELDQLRGKLAEDLAGAAARIEQLEGEKAAVEKALEGIKSELAKTQNALHDHNEAMAARFDASQKQVRDAVESALMAMPIPKWVGVWDRTKGYQAGEMVTWDGSVWHCNEACDGERPGGTKFWTLAVKRGQDAKQPEPANA